MSLSLDSRNAHQSPAPSLYVKFEAENKQGLVGLRKGESKKNYSILDLREERQYVFLRTNKIVHFSTNFASPPFFFSWKRNGRSFFSYSTKVL